MEKGGYPLLVIAVVAAVAAGWQAMPLSFTLPVTKMVQPDGTVITEEEPDGTVIGDHGCRDCSACRTRTPPLSFEMVMPHTSVSTADGL